MIARMRVDELAPHGLFVKICGITSEEDALLAVAMGADALGFVFAAGSTRQVSPALVTDIVKRLPHEVTTIGVFRNDAPERVVDIVRRCGLTGAQLHGGESARDCAQVARELSLTIQAFPAGDRSLDRARAYPVPIVLLDNARPGSGEVFDWSLADGVPDGKHLLLAGGLDADNVGDAIRQVQPWGVDVSTGVESSPGHKDARKVRRFVSAARAAAAPILAYRRDAATERDRDAPYDWQEDF